MDDRPSSSKVAGNLPTHGHEPALVQAAVRKIQRHYLEQGFTRHPASLRAILAVAALVRLSEKKNPGQGVAFACPGQGDTARTFLKAALEQFEAVSDRRNVG